jgi:twinkle protein
MIIEANELLTKLMEIRKANSTRKGVSTGFFSLDEYLYLSKQYLMVLTGMPSCGKSEVLDAIAVNTSLLHGWKWLYFSPENFPLEEHLKKLVEKKTGKNIHSMKEREIQDASEWVNDHFAWVHPDDDHYSLDAILSEVAIRIETGYQVDAIVIDPWNELDHSAQAGMRDDQYISKCLSVIRRFHRKYNLLTCIVIHPTKMQKDNTGHYPIPNLYDCNGGAMWRNKADFGLCVHRQDFNKHEAAVIIQKIKFKTMGKIGVVNLDYDLRSGRFKDQMNPDFTLPEVLPL